MLARRVIPCLDVDKGRVVKGVRFQGLVDAGDPVELGARYAAEGADELTFLDVSASKEARATLLDVVRAVARRVFVPFTVGGGVRTLVDMEALLGAGADKCSMATAALERPALIDEAAARFGSQFVVLSLDAKEVAPGVFHAFVKGGSVDTGLDAIAFAREAQSRGAGEILLNAMDADGTRGGFSLALTRRISDAARIPVIASGGAGELDHFRAALVEGGADAVLAASVFHSGKFTVGDVKRYLAARGVPVRV